VLEVIEKAHQDKEDKSIIEALSNHYHEIGKGIGVHKTPEVYGAFPTDPYSHTPMHKGAQQPGMTGQVKEDVLTRKGELGIKVIEGKLTFNPALIPVSQFLQQDELINFIDFDNKPFSITLEKGSLAFTICQVPIIYTIASQNQIEVKYKNDSSEIISSTSLSHDISQKIFQRTGEIAQVIVSINI
jgi:hypothetical protein